MTTNAPTTFERVKRELREEPRSWLVTGAAGFIGSHLVEHLLTLDQRVSGLDNFATGSRRNLAALLERVSPSQRERFSFREGDIRDPEACRRACEGVDLVLHQAALGSVPRSIKDPEQTNDVNVTGFIRVLSAARSAGIRRVVYASSSSVYGDHPGLPKVEEAIGQQLSPYAVSKYADELYAKVFGACHGLETVGLRYFNVFGPRQDPEGPYAAVMPRWFAGLLRGDEISINGDGETSRDFCFVENVVQANLLAATTGRAEALGQVFNVAYGERTTLNELFRLIREQVARCRPDAGGVQPVHREFRPGDVRHSLADVGKARRILDYEPTHSVREGLVLTASWYASIGAKAREATE
ncbi:MAG TPA: SDR family oxidoreductase [Anaeromyxobacteraceae bacterium]|jgi:UDP-N-acetylglucosamine 4-epimerase|nr:SDR family oxidoreductase [Anaeromyxobacteraceae bacterium]